MVDLSWRIGSLSVVVKTFCSHASGYSSQDANGYKKDNIVLQNMINR